MTTKQIRDLKALAAELQSKGRHAAAAAVLSLIA